MPARPRFVIGIDLGTTNCALAWADLDDAGAGGVPRVHRFAVPQLVAEGEVAPSPTLPSFLYVPSAEERASGRLSVPWARDDTRVAGAWARDHGALRPGRLVSSAKSWLCHPAVDRHAPILPWDADPAERVASPVDASAALLIHLRDAWNHTMAAGAEDRRLERQDVVLTVPASFDEEARELTVEAARRAGLAQLTLQEEPTAALYAWLSAHRARLGQHLRDGDTVLVCDVGGGTTDFTLVSAHVTGDEFSFERVAVGEHLLLGGDNLDLAIARTIESRLHGTGLTLRQRQALRQQSGAAKERLLSPGAPAALTISVLGSGRSVVGGAQAVELRAEDVRRLLLDGFLPHLPVTGGPRHETRTGLRELGLPYEADPAITRHLAGFLAEAGAGRGPVRPDVVLLNGGFFTPEVARARVVDVIRSWFTATGGAVTGDGGQDGWAPRVLANESPATAVAEGAAAYGLVRHGFGVRIGGGSARAYYVGLQAAAAGGHVAAVCVLPRGTEEGTRRALEGRTFDVVANRPRAFSLWSSRTRRDEAGDVVDLETETVHAHAPLVAELRYGKRSRETTLPVRLEVALTELGTLELWLVSRDTDHRWRLQFELRGGGPDAGGAPADESHLVVSDEALEAARAIVRATFTAAASADAPGPDQVPGALEATLGLGRHAWPVAAIRPLCDVLLEHVEGRRASPRHEARWLNLFGFCLRPGFGATLDDWRMTQARRVYLAGLAFAADVQCQAEWLVLWQRIAGGLTAGQQQDTFQRYAPGLQASLGKRGKRLAPQVERETWRLLASLERLPASARAALGEQVVARLETQRDNTSLWWSLGRVGARTPTYGPLNTVVSPRAVEAWLRRVLTWNPTLPDALAAVVDLAALTGDAARDVDPDVRADARRLLEGAGAAAGLVARLLRPQPASRVEMQRRYGESIPEGLKVQA